MATRNDQLILLLPFDEKVFKYTYFDISGKKYYVMDNTSKGGERYNIFEKDFPKGQTLSLNSQKEPRLSESKSNNKSFTSPKIENSSVDVNINTNLMDFYSEFPPCEWNNYSTRSLSAQTKDNLYKVLKSQIQGKSEVDAANILIDFVQKAFEYKTDGDQFGYERSLFADETFYYPYSDCEDRSILYSVLIRELLGLEIVLLNYPGHLATAVKFNSNVKGDYLVLEGEKYTVCDPTFIGAPIGRAMPEYKNTKAKIIKI